MNLIEEKINLLKVVMEDDEICDILRRLHNISYNPDKYEYFNGASNAGILMNVFSDEKINICKGLGLVYVCKRGVYITRKGYYVFEALTYIQKAVGESG